MSDVAGTGPMTPAEQEALARFRPRRSLRKRLAAPVVVAISKIMMERLNSLEIIGKDVFDEAHASDRPLLTLSNHVSLFDDPWLVATFSGSNWDEVRWCATDALNFFGGPLRARFFSAGKGVPIVRGAGIDQPGMTFLRHRLEEGAWVHIFPEGGRSRVPEKLRTPLKQGFAHLIRATRPLILPFHHTGMEDVLPIGARWPHFGNQLRLRFGQVTDSDEGLADQSPAEIAAWAERELLALEALNRE